MVKLCSSRRNENAENGIILHLTHLLVFAKRNLNENRKCASLELLACDQTLAVKLKRKYRLINDLHPTAVTEHIDLYFEVNVVKKNGCDVLVWAVYDSFTDVEFVVSAFECISTHVRGTEYCQYKRKTILRTGEINM